MIFVHLLLGIILGKFFGNYFFFIIGSILPDLDHLLIIIKNKFWSIKKIIRTIKYEKKFDIRYKTPFFHSILALILFSTIIYLFDNKATLFFGTAYLMHLLIDWIDIDEKYYLYPLKIKFRGFLPIWSKPEQILTIILTIFVIVLHS